IMDGSASLFSEKADLAPERNWTKKILTSGGKERCTFVLKDGNGIELLRQTEGEFDWTPESEISVGRQANYKCPEENVRTEDDCLQCGKTQELTGDLLSAVKSYDAALRKFPASYELNKAAGRLDAALKRFEEAAPHLAHVHERNTTDAEVSYYQAITLNALGKERAATERFEAAMRSPFGRAAAALELAELYARHNDLEKAEALVVESRKSAPEDLRAAEEEVAILHAVGRTEIAA